MSNVNVKRRRNASLEKKRARSGYVFTLPFILGIILVYMPILIDSIWWSFFSASKVAIDGAYQEVLTQAIAVRLSGR